MINNKIKIASSILNSDFARLEEQIKIVEDAGVDWLHLDIMDGHFVPNLTFGPPVIEKIRKVTDLPFDAHLMIEAPEKFIDAFKDAGVDHLTIHVETGYHLHRTIQRIHHANMKAGLTMNPATPVSILEPMIPFVDQILIMTVNPGFGGQEFIPQMLQKIKKAHEMIAQSGRKIHLEVDGGIDETTIPQVVQNGADVLVIGSAIYGEQDISAAVKKLKAVIEDLNGKNN